jgi:hypothetical protein
MDAKREAKIGGVTLHYHVAWERVWLTVEPDPHGPESCDCWLGVEELRELAREANAMADDLE